MIFTDHYRVLGIAADASPADIKTAYRKLARAHHPDVSKAPGAEKRFKAIAEAYEALHDTKRRAAFDAIRAGGWKEGEETAAPHPGGDPYAGAGADGGDGLDRFRDLFRAQFGRRAHAQRGSFDDSAFDERGEDVHYALAVSLEESYGGGERELQLQAPRSGGAGRAITVKIPKGVVDGTGIRLHGQGRPGGGAQPAGDLYLDVTLAPHRLFQVDGHDLTLALPIAPWEAVLGAEVAVPTLGGTVTATIPAGAHSGQKLRLRGRGLPGEPPGDQYLILGIALPPSVSDNAKRLYRELAKEAKETAFDPRAHLGA
jgi:curved DNA-binding protein